MSKDRFRVVKISTADGTDFDNSIIVVPYDYVTFNQNIPQHYVRYTIPENKDDEEFIKRMVQKEIYPIPESWNYYECEPLCLADTYNDAIDMIKRMITGNTEIIHEKDVSESSKSSHLPRTHEERSSVLKDITNTSTLTKNDLKVCQKEIIENLGSKIVNLEMKIDELVTLVIQRNPQVEVLPFSSFENMTSEFSFPLKTVEEFQLFDLDIGNNDSDVNKNLKLHLKSTINPKKDLTESMTLIFRRFFTRELLLKYTAQKKSGDKLMFKDTRFFRILNESIARVYGEESCKIEEFQVKQVIGIILNNSKDWDGHRRKRENKRPQDEECQ